VVNVVRRTAAIALGAVALLWGVPAWAGDQCLSLTAVNQRLQNNTLATDPNVGAGSTTLLDTITYTFFSTFEAQTSAGVPGLMDYCVYPDPAAGNPGIIVPDSVGAVGADGEAWDGASDAQGHFAFFRPHGDPSNIPFDEGQAQDGGTDITIGTATWVLAPPVTQIIVLHINDPLECSALYSDGSSTCYVLPGLTHGGPNPQPQLPCDGESACKQVSVSPTLSDDPLVVPEFNELFLTYTYFIVNQATNNFDMIFSPATAKTNDVNSGGGKDYFGCEQQPNPALNDPGQLTTNPQNFPNYQNTGFTMNFQLGSLNKNGTGCTQSRFYMQVPQGGQTVVLHPGNYITFTVDMVTRQLGNLKYEYTSAGCHFLNSGFTVKWFQSNDPKPLLRSFTTAPIQLDAETSPNNAQNPPCGP